MWLDLGRLSIGCGIGLLSYVVIIAKKLHLVTLSNGFGVKVALPKQVPVYISEITPKNLRGRFAAVNQLMICCGASLAYDLGTCITWRT